MRRLASVLAAGLLSLGCAKRSASHARDIHFLLYPAVEGAVGQKNCSDFFGRCMLFQTPEPVLEITDFDFKPVPSPSALMHNRIEISLSDSQSTALRDVTKRFGGEGKNLAIVYNGKIVHAPKIRGEITTSSVVLDFCNPHLYEIMLATLQGKIPPNYDFTKDKDCSFCIDAAHATSEAAPTRGG
jgi:hypothetical protein